MSNQEVEMPGDELPGISLYMQALDAKMLPDSPLGPSHNPQKIIGKCSLCGGLVRMAMNGDDQLATCSNCHAVEDRDLPIIKMVGGVHDRPE